MRVTAVVKSTRASKYEGLESYDMLCQEAPAHRTLMDAFHIVFDDATSGPKAGDVVTIDVESIRRYPLDGRNRFDGIIVPADGKKPA